MLLIGLIIILLAQALEMSNKSIKRITSFDFKIIVQILLGYTLYITLNNIMNINEKYYIFNGILRIDLITIIFDSLILISGILILMLLTNYPYNNNKYYKINKELKQNELLIIILFNIIGTTLLISSNDLIMIFLTLELQSYSLYILATISKESQKSVASGLKYFLLGILSSSLILLAFALLYSITGLTNIDDIILFIIYNENNYTLSILIIIILIGFLFKLAAAPFHNWSPDVYDGVPTFITSWLIIIPKISLFIFLSNFILKFNNYYSLIINNTHNYYSLNWLDFILLSSLLSLLIGTIVGLSQYKIKRLLAYSSISNIGLLLLILQIHSIDSIYSFYFYLIQYILQNINIFFILMSFGFIIHHNNINNDSPIIYIKQLKGQFQSNPYLALSFSITLFSLGGIPPFIGFFAKQILLLSCLNNGYYFLSFIVILTSIISIIYYLRIIKDIYLEKDLNIINNYNNKDFILNSSLSYIISILTLIIVLFVFKSDILLNSAQLLALTSFN